MRKGLSAESHFRRGRNHLEAGNLRSAFEHLRSAHAAEPDNPRYQSFYGLALGLAEGRFHAAQDLCRSAVKADSFDSDLYHNLARVHLALGEKLDCMRYLKGGLMVDPRNAALRKELRDLGVRRPPVLSFVRRDHPLNRWLGKLRYRLSSWREGATPMGPSGRPTMRAAL